MKCFEADKLWQSLQAWTASIDGGNRRCDAGKKPARITSVQTIAPLTAVVMKKAPSGITGVVTTPAGFKTGLAGTYAEGGWVGLGGNCLSCGLGMPKTLGVQLRKWFTAGQQQLCALPRLDCGCWPGAECPR